MAQKQKSGGGSRKIGRNRRRGRSEKYRSRNKRERHRAAEYRVKYGIGNGRLDYAMKGEKREKVDSKKK